MTSVFLQFMNSCWSVLQQMAFPLLAGFLAAGVIAAFLSEDFVRRHLGGRGFLPIMKSALLGVPMPLCSCGVLPVAAALKRSGASRGAVAAFLISVPQTGADNILVVWGLLGGVFALYSPVSAFLSGLFCGAACEYLGDKGRDDAKEEGELRFEGPKRDFLSILRYSYLTLVDDIASALLIGLAIAGLITIAIPDGWLAAHVGAGLGSMLLMLVIGIPLYVCSSGSVPIAAAFMAKGASPGAALVFLITGPASNAAGIAAISKMLGFRTAMIYIASLALFAFGSGLALNGIYELFPDAATAVSTTHVHGGEGAAWYQTVSALLLLALIGLSLFKGVFRRRIEMENGIKLKVEGMSCNHCARAVQGALSALPGVKAVAVDLKSGLVSIDASNLDLKQAKDAITKLGFKCD